MLMRYVSLGVEPVWAGVAISWLSFLGALVYLFRLAKDRFGPDAAGAGIALLACYPFAFFYSTAYTESLFLLQIAGACYHFERHQLARAALWGFAAGLTRPNGCLLSVVLGLMSLPSVLRVRDGDVRGAITHLAAAAAPGCGMLAYALYVYALTGNPFQWVVQNAAWGRVYRGLETLVLQHIQLLDDRGLYRYVMTRPVDVIHIAAAVFMLASVWPVARRLGIPYAVLVFVNVIAPLMMGGLLSMGRLTSVLFPVFLWLGAAIQPGHRTAWLIAFAMMQALLAGVFFTWRPLY
jgi:hypothetical protein